MASELLAQPTADGDVRKCRRCGRPLAAGDTYAHSPTLCKACHVVECGTRRLRRLQESPDFKREKISKNAALAHAHQKRTAATATNRYKRYTPKETGVLLDNTVPHKEAALRIGRSLFAVRTARGRLAARMGLPPIRKDAATPRKYAIAAAPSTTGVPS